jgi:hypothetical protein
MKELIEQVIWLGNYDLAQLLETIDRYHVEGRLTNEERQELYMAARKGAEPDYDYKGEIDALWAAVRELQKEISPPAPDEEWPEFVQPTHAGTAYQVGDKITFRGERYICIMAHCVWSPVDYPAAWEKQAEESTSGTEDDTAAGGTLAAATESKAEGAT